MGGGAAPRCAGPVTVAAGAVVPCKAWGAAAAAAGGPEVSPPLVGLLGQGCLGCCRLLLSLPLAVAAGWPACCWLTVVPRGCPPRDMLAGCGHGRARGARLLAGCGLIADRGRLLLADCGAGRHLSTSLRGHFLVHRDMELISLLVDSGTVAG